MSNAFQAKPFTTQPRSLREESIAAPRNREGENIHACNSEKKSAGSKRKLNDEQDSIRKPKRPMSSYNYFFKEDRSLIASALSRANTNEQVQEVLASFGENNIKLDKAPAGIYDTPLEKKKKFNGGVTFEDIGKIIGRRWRSLDTETLGRYRILAEADSVRYRDEMLKHTEENDRRLCVDALLSVDLERVEAVEYDVNPASAEDGKISSVESPRMIDSSAVEQIMATPILESFDPSLLNFVLQDPRNIASLISMDQRPLMHLNNSEPPYFAFAASNQTPLAIAGSELSNLNSNSSSNSIRSYMQAMEVSARQALINDICNMLLQSPGPQVAMGRNSTLNPFQGTAHIPFSEQPLTHVIERYANLNYPLFGAGTYFFNDIMSNRYALPFHARPGIHAPALQHSNVQGIAIETLESLLNILRN
mmetsp:Transcript_4517/g.6693  ORF Transcript_4517/g.6693 Transcript_4517/m.6693 type:complete len:421 (-) Transcript_4517:137-1399(-)|eukprot:CAMPEP_0172424484 /NCGR_PEP_ID=MMETSP1064-20121228/25640_1 /TAXON_ID=202472 /ORGANISM="Aulacoseira subarctica , Strain CCAP 1002/5" /LENGTH=420 /DNA_ID=CAMNT_0013166605 /DNA_START=12 /DNA_END=1274 /DNA_ORIENTATION=-